MARQHERLRVPEGWQGQARALIQQLERIHDDLYNLLGKGDVPEEVREFMDETSEDISDLQGDINDLDSLTQALAQSAAIVATGDTHQAITAGQFVFVQGHDTLTTGPYFAKSNIAANAALSTSNLGSVTKGFSNSLQAGINGVWTNSSVTSPATFDSDYVESASATMYKCGSLRQLYVVFTCKASGSGWQAIGSIASGHKPKDLVVEAAIDPDGDTRRCTVNSSGEISIQARDAKRYACSFMYFI